jgi:phosphoribosylanthranilate isomerase
VTKAFPHIKICGLTTSEAVACCADYGCGFNGFIAYAASPRHISLAQAQELGSHASKTAQKVLVTVNADDEFMDDYVNALHPDMLQLHGEESPKRCHVLRQRYGVPIIKAIAVRDVSDLAYADAFSNAADMLLLDTKKADGSTGGTGQSFDWEILQHFNTKQPYFLSGGIGAHNAHAAIEAGYTSFLDVSSALEEKKGIKSVAKMKDFFDSLS